MGDSEKSRFFGTDLKMDRPLLQMFDVATIGSRAGSQAVGEVCHRLVDVFFRQLFPDGPQSDYQLSNRVWLQLEFIVLFQHGHIDEKNF